MRRLRAAAPVLGSSLLLAGCFFMVPNYVQPRPEQPHALLKVRVIHHATPGPSRSASLLLNKQALPLPEQPDLTEAATTSVRVRPEGSYLRLGTEFYHTNTRTESYTATEQYACGTTRSGSYTSTQYCSRSVSKSRVVTDHVTDASCAGEASLAPSVGKVYLLQYDFYGHDECSLKCFLQTPKEGAEFDLAPCPEAPPKPAH